MGNRHIWKGGWKREEWERFGSYKFSSFSGKCLKMHVVYNIQTNKLMEIIVVLQKYDILVISHEIRPLVALWPPPQKKVLYRAAISG